MKTFLSSSPVFMGILTLVLIVMVAWFIYNSIISSKNTKDNTTHFGIVKNVTSIGLFALVIGVLHQLIAWYTIIADIEQAGDITPGIVISAIKTSVIPLIYAVSIFLLSLIFWMVSKFLLKEQAKV